MRSVNLALFIHLTWNTLSNSDKLGLNQKISGLEKKKKWERMDLFGATLLDQTLDEIKSDDDFQETVKRMNKIGVAGIAINERINRHRALDSLKIPEFNTFLLNRWRRTVRCTDRNHSSCRSPLVCTVIKLAVTVMWKSVLCGKK